jgi:hypothetical protein
MSNNTPKKSQENNPKLIYTKHPNNVNVFRFSNSDLDDELLQKTIQTFLQKKGVPQSLRRGSNHFQFQSNQLTDRSCHHIAKFLLTLAGKKSMDPFHIQELNLSGNQIEGNQLQPIFDPLFAYNEINLSWNNLGMRAMQSISHFLKNGSNIEVLNLNKNEIGSRMGGALSYLCRNGLLPNGNSKKDAKKSSLKSLLLKDNGIQAKWRSFAPQEIIMPTENDEVDDVMCLSAVIADKNCSLTELNLSQNRLGEYGTPLLAMALRKNTSLKVLNLSHNAIGVNGFRYIAESLLQNETLEILNLSCNIDDLEVPVSTFTVDKPWIPDYDTCLFAISHALRKNSTLKSLSLMLSEGYETESAYHGQKKLCTTDTVRKQWGLEWLFESLRVNRSLRYLDIRHTFMTEITKKKLLKMLRMYNTTLTNVLITSIDHPLIASAIDFRLAMNRLILKVETSNIDQKHLPSTQKQDEIQEKEEQSSSIDTLPSELLFNVMSFLSVKHILGLRLVSKHFDVISTHGQTWRQVYQQYPNYQNTTDYTMISFKKQWYEDQFLTHSNEWTTRLQNLDKNYLFVQDLIFLNGKKKKKRNSVWCYSRRYGVIAMLETILPFNEFTFVTGVNSSSSNNTLLSSNSGWQVFSSENMVYVDIYVDANTEIQESDENITIKQITVSMDTKFKKGFCTPLNKWITAWIKFIEKYRWNKTKVGAGSIASYT